MRNLATLVPFWFPLMLASGVPPQQWPAEGDTVFVNVMIVPMFKFYGGLLEMPIALGPCRSGVVTKAEPRKSKWRVTWGIKDELETTLEGPWLEWMHKDKATCQAQTSAIGVPLTRRSDTIYELAPGQSGVVPPRLELPPVPANALPPDFEDCVRANAEAVPAAALPDLERKALAGDPEAQFLLGEVYINGRHVERDVAKGLDLHEKSAAQGYRPAQLALAERYAAGTMVTQDYKRASAWFLAAATQGSPDAQHNLSVLYRSGQGVTKDLRAAHAWMKRAAEQGHAVSQYQLGLMYAAGQGVAEDYTEAAAWMRRAAEGGDADAQVYLGVLYDVGRGVTKDGAEAVQWYLRAAAQNHPEAMVFLGVRNRDGRSVPSDLGAAAKYFRQAAELGHNEAMCYLGDLYQTGRGVEQSNREAYRWFYLGTAAGATDCRKQLDSTKKLLTKAERETIEREAQQWAAALQQRVKKGAPDGR